MKWTRKAPSASGPSAITPSNHLPVEGGRERGGKGCIGVLECFVYGDAIWNMGRCSSIIQTVNNSSYTINHIIKPFKHLPWTSHASHSTPVARLALHVASSTSATSGTITVSFFSGTHSQAPDSSLRKKEKEEEEEDGIRKQEKEEGRRKKEEEYEEGSRRRKKEEGNVSTRYTQPHTASQIYPTSHHLHTTY